MGRLMFLHVVPYLEVYLESPIPSTAAVKHQQREGYVRWSGPMGGFIITRWRLSVRLSRST